MEVQQAHEAALMRTAAQNKPPAANARPWPRSGGSGGSSSSAAPPPPPKVYRVEPREFRDLVQRLTGAPPPSTAQRRPQNQHQHQHHHHCAGVAVAPVVQPHPVRAAQQQQAYGGAAATPWFAFPMEAAAAQPQHGAFL